MGARHRRARLNYVAAHGNPPYVCDHCGCALETLEVVHHRDHDSWNNSVENLAAMHKGCHNVHHGIGQNHPPEVIARIVASNYKPGGRWGPRVDRH